MPRWKLLVQAVLFVNTTNKLLVLRIKQSTSRFAASEEKTTRT
jgi:hypothetical protein